jgi:hypothetical protein
LLTTKEADFQPSNLLLLARPWKKTRFKAKVVEGIAILQGENGEVAVVPKEEVCRLAERLNLEIEGYKC